MRILYVGNAGGLKNAARFYLFPARLINGLTREGHTVHVFNDRDVARSSNIFGSSRLGGGKTNQALLQTCKDFMPEMVILAHCEIILNETIDAIRTICPGVKIVLRNVDPPSDYGNISRVKARMNHVDGIFITTAGPILRELCNDKTFSAFLPNPVDISIDRGRAFAASSYDADLFFAAGPLQEHRQRLVESLLQRIPTVKSEIIGAGVNTNTIFGLPYMEKLSRVKMGLIINKTEDFYLYASDRMSQYMGNGMMVFAHTGPNYNDIFTTDEIVTYANVDELADKVNFYATHDSERRRIAENGYHRAHEVFNTQIIARYMVETTFDESPRQYPWPCRKHTG